ncbi:hypothetical protein ART_3422 [Arthrobacter sp. PAMC 25486]|uniref:hypothetical protein n=1 Tax=Arthrobacter sp. PAMC 25486 TaxID=1494608 RepID=UPI000535C4D2|nr:hypothetical protein [Arthrobacter sp. PAMC 25486]AIY03021.1 hypothetical protein ART_3422 [Arthrobacter sp. PAMC 25486]
MNKFDPDSSALMMAIIDAERKHPKQEELPTVRFPAWKQPQIKFNGQAGVAVGWTRSYGLVQFVDSGGEQRLEWVAAGLIKRVWKLE